MTTDALRLTRSSDSAWTDFGAFDRESADNPGVRALRDSVAVVHSVFSVGPTILWFPAVLY